MNNKYKIIILTIAFLTIYTSSSSQNVIVELKTHWKTEYNCLKDTVEMIPYLDIVYSNNTSQDIYFSKICKSLIYPNFSDVTMMNYVNKNDDDFIKKRALRHLSYSSCYNVYIGDNWTIFDTIHNPETDLITDEFINSDVYYIYEWMKQQIYNFDFIDSYYNVVNTVFLKSGDSYTDSYNIMPLLINDGQYIFKIGQVGCNHNCVVTKYKNNYKKNGITMKCEQLPEMIEGFKRYDGEITIIETMLDLSDRFGNVNR